MSGAGEDSKQPAQGSQAGAPAEQPAQQQANPQPPAAKEHPLAKQCRVKTAGLQRYQKEYNSYVKEQTMNENRVNLMVQEGKDEHDISKAREVLKETEVMIPIVKDKLSEAIVDLEDFLEENEEELKTVHEEGRAKAVEQIGLSKAFLESLTLLDQQ